MISYTLQQYGFLLIIVYIIRDSPLPLGNQKLIDLSI